MDGPRTKVELFAAIRRDSRTTDIDVKELIQEGSLVR